jgi:hypothetical protein
MTGSVKLNTPSSGSVTLSPADTASNVTVTVPAVTDTLVNLTSTQTLTNKTLSGAKLPASSGGSVSLVAADTASNLTATIPAQTATLQIDGPAFSGYNGSSQSISGNIAATIAIDTTHFNVGGCFNTSTYRFTPNVPGYYQFNCIFTASGTAGAYTVCLLYKNGSQYIISNTQRSNGNYNCAYVNGVVYLNGTTDYITMLGYDNANCSSIAVSCYFSAFLARGA